MPIVGFDGRGRPVGIRRQRTVAGDVQLRHARVRSDNRACPVAGVSSGRLPIHRIAEEIRCAGASRQALLQHLELISHLAG